MRRIEFGVAADYNVDTLLKFQAKVLTSLKSST